jgi:hypothetical protein
MGERGNPYPVGVPVSLQTDSTAFELTVKEIIRGENAWQQLQDRYRNNPDADPGYEYMLVYLELAVTSGPDDKAIELWRYDFEWVTDNQVLDFYTNSAKNVVEPEPKFDVTLYPNSSAGGWIVIQVKTEDEKPLLVFARSGSNPGFFFALY